MLPAVASLTVDPIRDVRTASLACLGMCSDLLHKNDIKMAEAAAAAAGGAAAANAVVAAPIPHVNSGSSMLDWAVSSLGWSAPAPAAATPGAAAGPPPSAASSASASGSNLIIPPRPAAPLGPGAATGNGYPGGGGAASSSMPDHFESTAPGMLRPLINTCQRNRRLPVPLGSLGLFRLT